MIVGRGITVGRRLRSDAGARFGENSVTAPGQDADGESWVGAAGMRRAHRGGPLDPAYAMAERPPRASLGVIGHRRLLAVLAAVCVASFSGCSAQPTTQASRSLSVPALWAGTGTDGQPTGGIAWAQIEVGGGSGANGYSVDLATQTAQGAGPSWNVAAGAAATTATLLSGVDPAKTEIGFSVDGAIDGPSAGGILTVGVMAALKGHQLNPDVTMTGTISPDGGIGPIGGAATKVKAAAAAGFKTVLLPASNFTDFDAGSSGQIDVTALGRSLNIEVAPIANVGEAYLRFTGSAIAPSSDVSAPPLSPAVQAQVRESANALATRIRRSLSRSEELLPQKSASDYQSTLQKGVSDIQQNRLPEGYALLTSAYLQLSRDLKAARVRDSIRADGLKAVTAQVFAESDALALRGQQRLDRAAADAISGGLEAQLATPVNMSDLVGALAIVSGARAEMTGREGQASSVIDFARVLAQEQVWVDVVAPNAQRILQAAGASGSRPAPAQPTADFLSSYTNFLVRAGQANQQYYEQVLSATSKNPNITVAGHLYAAIKVLAQQANAIPTGAESPEAEQTESATAFSYFLLSAALVAAPQNYGAMGTGIGESPISLSNPAALDSAIQSGPPTVFAFANSLQGSGLNPQFEVWTAMWGASAASAATSNDLQPAVLGVGQMWNAATASFLLAAARDHVLKARSPTNR